MPGVVSSFLNRCLKYPVTFSLISYSVLLYFFASVDAFEQLQSVLESMEDAEIDEFFLALVVFSMVSVVVLYIRKKTIKTEAEKTIGTLQKQLQGVKNSLLFSVSPEERIVLNHLIQNHGVSTQSQLAQLDTMNNVKAFRVVKSLKQKRMIEVESHGKRRTITLADALRDAYR